jgi:hypothetical protein
MEGEINGVNGEGARKIKFCRTAATAATAGMILASNLHPKCYTKSLINQV